ncbi:S-adenosyl-L-methionine-dependent methyltransferase [Podospora didyma]|uniref:S-adenosyl-L-methionine-dependent methyltransferase n=1 Tax=Podospora didyma TaxID=330526 RepID=A0AAE0K976_9PEZI|nr:S-adenosyl-L-methionine-dependent methyltransferase [Podospora didyma]
MSRRQNAGSSSSSSLNLNLFSFIAFEDKDQLQSHCHLASDIQSDQLICLLIDLFSASRNPLVFAAAVERAIMASGSGSASGYHHGDGHGHGHDHEHHSSHLNKEFFNSEAATYDAKHEKTLSQIVMEIRSRLDFIGVDWVDDDSDSNGDDVAEQQKNDDAPAEPKRQVRLLDYACGTGVVSRALAPYTTQCVGIDLSENMAAAYNARAENQGLAVEEMHAYQGNLCTPENPSPPEFASPEFFGFDIAAVGLGFHHFDDPALAARRLVERLKPGGVLLILDFLPHDKMDSAHAASHTVTHHGFSETQIRELYEQAGAGTDFKLESVAVVFNRATESKPEMRRQLFLARGVKV